MARSHPDLIRFSVWPMYATRFLWSEANTFYRCLAGGV